MFLRHTRLPLAISALLLSLTTAAGAAVLWDQSAIDPVGSISNNTYTGAGGFEFFSVNDITVPAGGWTINTITEYWEDAQPVDMNLEAPTGSLILMPKTGSLPAGTPTLITVSLTWVDLAPSGLYVNVMTCSGLNLNLAPGDYWITVAPTTPRDNLNGNNLQRTSAKVGSQIASWYSGAWSVVYPSRDGAFKLEGTAGAATPTGAATWGGLKALYR